MNHEYEVSDMSMGVFYLQCMSDTRVCDGWVRE